MESQDVVIEQEKVKEELFGINHWVMLLRVEGWAVMANGEIDKTRMRTNWNKRPPAPKNLQWDKTNSTRLYTGEIIEDHDDWDCLQDLIDNGFIDTEFFKNKMLVKLSEKGFQTFVKLRKFRKNGKKLHLFKP